MFYDFWRNRSRTSFGAWISKRYQAKQLDILNESSALKGKVLEVGPGDGDLARRIEEFGAEYYGLERSPALCEAIADEGIRVIQAIAPPLPFKNERFDLVCALRVLEHMATYEQSLQLLAECNRILKPGGVLAILAPDYRRCGIDFFNWDYTHSYVTTPFRVQMSLVDTGFEPHRTIHFTGVLSSILRFPIDLLGFVIHSRPMYWLLASMGLEGLLLKYHKTFEPAFMIVSRKTSPSAPGTNRSAGSA